MRQTLKGRDMLLEEKRKIFEFYEFSILTYTQNWKLGNLGKFSFASNFDSSCNLTFKNNKNISEAKSWKLHWSSSSCLEDMEIFSFNINTTIFWVFWHFLAEKKCTTSSYNRWCCYFFFFHPTLNWLFSKFIKSY